MKIGDSVWIYDSNCRIYPKDENGKHIPNSSPDYRLSWLEKFVIGETRISWIVANSRDAKPGQKWRCHKIPKKPEFQSTEVRGVAYSAEELDAAVWQSSHRWRVIRMVEHCNGDTLRKIAELVGYQPEAHQ